MAGPPALVGLILALCVGYAYYNFVPADWWGNLVISTMWAANLFCIIWKFVVERWW